MSGIKLVAFDHAGRNPFGVVETSGMSPGFVKPWAQFPKPVGLLPSNHSVALTLIPSITFRFAVHHL